jgi:hypothetical protein
MAKEMTSSQVAERLDVAHSTVRAWCNKGLFPNATRHETPAGSYWTIPEGDLKKFQQPQPGRPPKQTASTNGTQPASGSNAALTAAAKAEKKGKK